MKIKKKICICILLIILLVICTGSIAYAAEGESSTDVLGAILDTILKLLGSVVGIFTWPVRLMVLAVTVALETVISTFGHVAGGSENLVVTPFTILFNKLEITNIDFFDFSGGNNSFISGFRENIAMWYYVLRFIATAILLAILFYIGTRMAISTVADEKAKYKKMIVDWVVSLALLYLLHYIIVFVITLNAQLVQMLSDFADEDLNFGWLIAGLLGQSVNPLSGIGGWAALILFTVFVWQTVKFFIMYVKRMITIGFLILISPLITITYSVDRAGDQKAQALNTWLKEFIYNVLIQPFHCVLYLSFAQVAFSTIIKSDTDTMFELLGQSLIFWDDGIGNLFFAVLCLAFVNSGEKIVREIFGFNKTSTVGDMVGAAAVVTSVVSTANKVGDSAKKAGGLTKVMFPGMDKITGQLGNTNIAQKFKDSQTGKFLSGVGKSASTGIANWSESIRFGMKPGDAGFSLGDVARGGAKIAGGAASAAIGGVKFVRNGAGKAIKEFGNNHPVAKEIFGVAGSGIIKGFKAVPAVFTNPQAWAAVMAVQGASFGLAMKGEPSDAMMLGYAAYNFTSKKFQGSRTAEAMNEGLKESLNRIENITGKEMTTEEFIEHIKTVVVSGNVGQYTPEKLNAKTYKMFTAFQKASTNGEINQQDLSKSFTVMQNTFQNGGDHVQASLAMFEQLRRDGHEINPEKKKELTEMVKNWQLQRESANLYHNWQMADRQGIPLEQFAAGIMGADVPKVAGGKTDAATVTAFNENQDTASAATKELDGLLKDLRKGAKSESGPVELDASVLMGMLAQMASQIMAYQASGHVNEVVIKEMVSTYNITAERTNKLELEFDTSKVKQLSRVRKFEADGENPGKFKLEESRDI